MYALDWSKSRHEQDSFRLAVGSFIEDNNNKVNTLFLLFTNLTFSYRFKLLPELTFYMDNDNMNQILTLQQ